MIPEKLQREEFRFCLIRAKDKRPFEFDWQKTNNYKYNDKKLLDHISNGGNYGIVCGYGNLLVIDFDEEDVQKKIDPDLPETFTVKTGRGLLHKYFICDETDPIKVLDKDKNTLADIQGNGKQIIAPGSLHPNGNRYEIVEDRLIANITMAEIKALFSKYKDFENKNNKVDKIVEKDDIINEIKSKVSVTDMLNRYGISISKNPTTCPLHSSRGGKCLSFKDDVWHCFHCDEGGDIFSLRMLNENIDFSKAKRLFCEELDIKIKERKKDIAANITFERPEIEHPKTGKSISEFALEVGDILKDKQKVFYRTEAKDIIEVRNMKVSENDNRSYQGFSTIKPNRFITLIEEYLTPVVLTKDKTGDWGFKKKSITAELANTTLCSDILESALPPIKRIFNVQLPIIYNGELTFPKKGYDARFGSWLSSDAPEIRNPNMSLEEAKELLSKVFFEFCFKSRQDYTNTIAALLTPFLRGLFSRFNTRCPLFFYIANRERAGKDYLAGITGILYEGENLEEPPISTGENNSNNTEELRKKILAAFLSGRKRLHFQNNKGYINNSVLEGLATATTWSDRILGKSENLVFDNELDISLSGNVGIGYTADLNNRSRKINLFLDIEDANSRKFKNPDLHGWVKKNREEILSALYTLVRHWINKGSPESKIPFSSFPEWARVCGGILETAGYESPCNPDQEMGIAGGDAETGDMKALFELCYEKYPEKWIERYDIINEIKNSNLGLFSYIDLGEKPGQVKFGMKLNKFIGRYLSDILLKVQDDKVRVARQKLMFSKLFQQKLDISLFGNLGNLGNLPTSLDENES